MSVLDTHGNVTYNSRPLTEEVIAGEPQPAVVPPDVGRPPRGPPRPGVPRLLRAASHSQGMGL